MRVADALAHARLLSVDRLDAQLLLAHRLGRPRAWLIAHGDDDLSAADEQALMQALAQRRAGVPLAYLVGEREFHGLCFAVSPDVLVPRPDTELLVDWALERLADRQASRVLDLGTGSGAVAVSVARRCPAAHVTATDNSPASLDVARGNARAHRVSVQFEQGDWWQPLAGRRFDLVLSNPPYIAADDPHLPALAHEPLQALTPGGDGLGALRQIVIGAPRHLDPGGWLLLEHGHDQGGAVRSLLDAAGFSGVQTRHDLGGRERCTGGCHAPG